MQVFHDFPREENPSRYAAKPSGKYRRADSRELPRDLWLVFLTERESSRSYSGILVQIENYTLKVCLIRLCEKPIRSDSSPGFAFTFFTFACLAHVPEM